MREDLDALRLRFLSEFSQDSTRIFFAPGRINLIGEHIDYLGGSVLPAAIDRGILALARPRSDSRLRLRSVNLSDGMDLDLLSLPGEPASLTAPWAAYCVGIARLLNPTELRGADILFASDLPVGSGLSSSAALEVLTGFVLTSLAAGPDPLRPSDEERIRLALLCKQAENEYAGVACGVMDQFAVAMGRRGHALHLDTQNLSWKAIPVQSADYTLFILNSNRPRKLQDSHYNERRAECEEALALIRRSRPDAASLTRATSDDLMLLEKHPVLFRRARHAITENRRVNVALDCLSRSQLAEFGELLNQSHASLRDDFEVSSEELDVLHRAALATGLCAGTRMIGAGFGGCSIALVRTGEESERTFCTQVSSAYLRETGLVCDIFPAMLEDGVRELC